MKDRQAELKKFAEALLDIDRLKIVGELARGGRSVADLARRVQIDLDIVVAHLEKLSLAGVVSLEKDMDGALTYSLDDAALAEMSRRQVALTLASREQPVDRRPIGPGFSPEDIRHIHTFTTPEGIITHLPSIKKRAKLMSLLRYSMQDLQFGQRYTEAEFNAALARFTHDPAEVRRELIDWGFVDRKKDGSAYWLKGDRNDG